MGIESLIIMVTGITIVLFAMANIRAESKSKDASEKLNKALIEYSGIQQERIEKLEKLLKMNSDLINLIAKECSEGSDLQNETKTD
jgi:hypothetical protein